jgi:hypothetical protein
MTVRTGPALVEPVAAPAQHTEWLVLERRRDLRGALARLPGWGQALLLLTASRVLFAFVAHRSAAMAAPHPDGRRWTYWEIANNWDGTWYHRIVLEGYPSVLPVDRLGEVVSNTWAFYPLFPRAVQVVMRVTGLAWTSAATVVSLAAAAGAVVILRSVLEHVAGPRTALGAVALLCFFPSSLVLQLPYSESLALLLIATVFWCLQRHRYLAVIPALLLLGLSRPVGVPMAIVLAAHLVREMIAVRGMPRPVAVRSLAGPGTVFLVSGLAAVEWPLIVWRGTGVFNGYTQTMAAWRTPKEVVPVRPWIGVSQHFLGQYLGPVVLVAVFALLMYWLFRSGRPVVGADLTMWCVAYTAYLLAFLDSFTSLPRYLLPLFPMGAMLISVSSSRAYRAAVTTAFALAGIVWILVIWRSRCWAP